MQRSTDPAAPVDVVEPGSAPPSVRSTWARRARRALAWTGVGHPTLAASVGLGPSSESTHNEAVLDALSEGVLVQDTDGRLLYANRRARELLPRRVRPPAEPPGPDVVVDASGQVIEPELLPGRRALREGRSVEGEILGVRTAGGAVRWLEVSSHPMTAPGGTVPYAVVSAVRDITDRREADDLLAVKARLLDSVGQAVVAWDTTGRITFVNSNAEALYGWTRAQAVGRNIDQVPGIRDATDRDGAAAVIDALMSGQAWEGELAVRRADGTALPVWSTNTPILEAGEIIGHIGVSKDISDRKAVEAHLDHLVRHDVLTDLPTRRAFTEHVDRRLGRLERGTVASVVLLDIGSLDLLNDAFSHDTGDAVVLRCADLLRASAHPGDDLARISDHAFAVCRSHDPAEPASTVAEVLRLAVREPFAVGGIEIRLQASAAVSTTGDPVGGGAELVQQADTALLRARRDRTTRVYDASMREEILRQVHIGHLVDRLLASDAIDLGYQPIVRLSDQMTVGAEALLRVLDDGEPVAPPEIVDAAERNGRMADLGALILRTACRDAASWPRAVSGRPMGVSVNLSTRQLDDPDLVGRVTDALEISGLPAASLCLEVTETTLMADPEWAASQLVALRASGVRFAADDFGTGYSSLAYLKALPLDVLKIDRTFIDGLPRSLEDVAITQAVLAMSDALGLAVTAEGVETEEQLGALLELGTGFGQGYLWGKAMTSTSFADRIRVEALQPTLQARVPAPWRIQPPAGPASSEERIDSILGILAHEIRSPLSVVAGYAGILERAAEPAAADAAAAIGRASLRISRILDNMVDLSAQDEGGRAGDPEVLDVVAAARQVMEDLPPSTSVRLHPPDPVVEPVAVTIDREQFVQVVTNLLSNAATFAPTGSPVELAVTQAGGWVDVSVTDRGPGISADDLGLVFRKYGRTDPLGKGSGLGLYLARQIARRHGGDILYRRAPTTGSIFVFRLPAATTPDPPTATPGAA